MIQSILLKSIYPFWYFFDKTLVGNSIIAVLLMTWPAILMTILFPETMMDKNGGSEGLVVVILVFTLLCFPFLFMWITSMSMRLDRKFKEMKI